MGESFPGNAGLKDQLASLSELLRSRKTRLIEQWQLAVRSLCAAAPLDNSTLRDHIPQFIDELIAAIATHHDEVAELRNGGSPIEHGRQRLVDGFNIKEVVLEYNILRDVIHAEAEAAGIILNAAKCRVVNHIIDDAIAQAVERFAADQSSESQRRRDEHFAFIAHDVRTPLNAIALAASVLASEADPADADGSQMFRVLLRNVHRIETIIERTVLDQKSDELDMRPTCRELDLWPLVRRLLEDLKPMAEKANTRLLNAVPQDLIIYADAGLLSRALQNLVANSLRFTTGGSVEVGGKLIGAEVECWVRDTGAGIAPDRLQHIFEKAHTDPDPARAGTGLGLAIFKRIVEAHGGSLKVESAVGMGTTFRFRLPNLPEA